jgi:hypothetical protein
VQSEHTEQLFEVANNVVESMLLNEQFHNGLPRALEAEGLDAAHIADDLLDAIDELDGIWLRQVPGFSN